MTQSRFRFLLTLLLFSALSLAAAQPDRLRSHVVWLSDPARQGRHAGQAGAAASAEYISTQFRQNGFSVQMQEFGANRRNVVARYGTARDYIVIGAHYDGQGSGLPSASDNAAGVAVLIELGRELKSTALPVSLVLVAFDDEEQGENGSRYFVDHPLWPLENARSAVIIDTLGRPFIDLQSWTLFVLGTEYSSAMSEVVARHSRPDLLVAGVDLVGPRSDFAPFAVKHVPFLFFSDGTHQDYHGAGDTADKVNYSRLAMETDAISAMVRDIARLKAKPVYRDRPVYPSNEIATLTRVITAVEKERKDLPAAYQMVFEDMRERVKTDPSRETLNVAASALLGLATPRFSSFMLDFIVEPFYERQNKEGIVSALKEESARWSR